MILVAQDVADHGEVAAFQDQAHRDARDRTLQRHARIHQRKRLPPHTVAIDDEPLDSVMSERTRIV